MFDERSGYIVCVLRDIIQEMMCRKSHPSGTSSCKHEKICFAVPPRLSSEHSSGSFWNVLLLCVSSRSADEAANFLFLKFSLMVVGRDAIRFVCSQAYGCPNHSLFVTWTQLQHLFIPCIYVVIFQKHLHGTSSLSLHGGLTILKAFKNYILSVLRLQRAITTNLMLNYNVYSLCTWHSLGNLKC